MNNNHLLLIAAGLGITACFFYTRRKTNSKHRDANEEDLYGEIAQRLSRELDIPESDLLAVLRREPDVNSEVPLKQNILLEASFRKVNATTVAIEITAAYRVDAEVRKSTLKRQLSWDEVPKSVRSDFIRSGERHLHYSLGSNQNTYN